ncbi:MAG TPA: septum formation initiator family protein [Gemmatimonadales bacterium]|jgi:cell division protein FtsB
MTRARWLGVAALIVAILFAWGGGAFSHSAYQALQREEAADVQLQHDLIHVNDSLKALRDSLQNNPETQLRYAREVFGMTWPGEKSFLVHVDSAQVPGARGTAGP